MRHVTPALTAALAGLAILPAAASASASTAPIAPHRIVGHAPVFTAAPGGDPLAEQAGLVQLGTPSPSSFQPLSAQAAVAEYLDAWHDRAWDRMALWSLDGAGALQTAHAADRLRGWAITGALAGAHHGTVHVIAVTRGMRPALERHDLTFELVPDDGGRWRVKASR